ERLRCRTDLADLSASDKRSGIRGRRPLKRRSYYLSSGARCQLGKLAQAVLGVGRFGGSASHVGRFTHSSRAPAACWRPTHEVGFLELLREADRLPLLSVPPMHVRGRTRNRSRRGGG